MSRLIHREPQIAGFARKSESRKPNSFRTFRPLCILKESFEKNA